MAITVTCPSCSTAFPVDPAKIPEGGVNARCSSCGDIFRVEKPVEAEPLPTLEDFAPDESASPPQAPPAQPATPLSPQAAPEPPAPPTEPPALPTEPPAPPTEPAAPPAEPPAAEPPVPDPFAQPAPFEQAAPDTETEQPAEPLPAPEPEEPMPPAETAEPLPTPDSDDVSAPSPQPAAPEPNEPQPADAVAETSAPAVQGFTFGKRDPKDKAKRLARVLVSDMIMYNAERHQSALAQGTLQQDFEEEIEKSWKEFVEQVGEELANAEGRQYWKDALNDILAKGDEVF